MTSFPFDDRHLHIRFVGDRINIDPDRLDSGAELFPDGWDEL